MLFNEFSKTISSALNAGEHKQMEILANLLSHATDEDLGPIIYLCQGRLGPPTSHFRRVKGWLTQAETFARLRYAIKSKSSIKIPSLVELLDVLRGSVLFDDISKYRNNFPDRVMSIASGLDMEDLNLIALIFAKGIFKDAIILDALAKTGGGGLGAKRAISHLYMSTIPDLGKIALFLRRRGYFDTVTLGPQFGTVVPRENIATWVNIDHAWNELKPAKGLFIQAKFFDGLHIQLHKRENDVILFNIMGNNISSGYSHLRDAIVRSISAREIIVDCELIALDTKRRKVLPLYRIRDTRDHILAAFDLLQLEGEDWRKKQYWERKSKLEELFQQSELRRSGIYLPREEFATTLIEAKEIVESYFSQPQFEGVILKTPSSLAKTGASSKERGRVKPYTVLDSVLIGYNEKPESFLVGLWADSEKKVVLPYRTVEGVKSTFRKKLSKFVVDYKTKERPKYIGPGPVPTWYITKSIVVAVKCDGFIVPNRSEEFATKWLLHEGVTIEGLYPLGQKQANTLSYLYNLRKRNNN